MAQMVMTVDHNAEQARVLEKHIRQEMGMATVHARTGEEALRHIASGTAPQPDVVLLDLGMRTASLDTVRALRSFRNDMQIIILVNHALVDTAITALSCGATDFLLMPFHGAQLTAGIRNALIRRDLQLVTRRSDEGEILTLEDITAKSAAFSATIFLAKKLAHSDAALILEGAAGMGREFLARAIHGSSPRCAAPFFAVNGAAFHVPEVHEKLFGSEETPGICAKLRDGTLLLRNVDALSAEVRHHLLQVVEQVVPIHPSRPDAYFRGRLIFAVSDSDGRASLQERREISQLFSAMNALPIRIPNLRDMSEDIPFLARLLMRRYAALEGKTITHMSVETERLLREISWPGNMEQLSQAVFHAVMCCQGHELQVEDFRYLFRPHNAQVSVLNTASPKDIPVSDNDEHGLLQCVDESGNIKRLQDMEQEVIRYALERYSGHMSQIARHLGIGRSTLYRKISSMDGK